MSICPFGFKQNIQLQGSFEIRGGVVRINGTDKVAESYPLSNKEGTCIKKKGKEDHQIFHVVKKDIKARWNI